MNLPVGEVDQGVMQVSPELQTAEVAVPANVICLAASGGKVAAGLGDGAVMVSQATGLGEVTRHSGAVSFVGLSDHGQVISAGQDGLLKIDGTEVFSTKGPWFSGFDLTEGHIALATERAVVVLDAAGALVARFDDHPSTVSGVALSPDGTRVAAAHYNAVTLHSLTDLAKPVELNWRGSLTGVSWSADGRYVVAATQDRELHIWDLVTGKDFRLGGYNRKVRQIGWSVCGNFLVSTGADVVVAWPLAGDPGTMPPVEIGFAYAATVSAVPTRIQADKVAAGFTNGTVILGETVKGTAKIARGADGDSITTVDWDRANGVAAYGTAAGKIGIVKGI